jgi:hypothetical protein
MFHRRFVCIVVVVVVVVVKIYRIWIVILAFRIHRR